MCVYDICFNERCRRKEERSKQDQTNNKAKQHSTPKAVTFPKKNELLRVGLEPTTLCTGLGLISTFIYAIYIYTYIVTIIAPVFLYQVLSATALYITCVTTCCLHHVHVAIVLSTH